MASKYLLQIVHRDTGKVAEWEPGRGVEIDFIEAIVKKVLAKGVGVFRTSTHVAIDLQNGIEEAIHELKSKIHPKY